MIEVLLNVFPELLDPSQEDTFVGLFLQPLLNLLRANASKPQATSACFCLRKIIQLLIREYRNMITPSLCELITNTAIKSRQCETNLSELLRDLMRANPDAGVAGLTKNSKQLFDYILQ